MVSRIFVDIDKLSGQNHSRDSVLDSVLERAKLSVYKIDVQLLKLTIEIKVWVK